MKDVKIPNDAIKTLLLEKHAEFIAAYGNKKDDYVRALYLSAIFVVGDLYRYLASILWDRLSSNFEKVGSVTPTFHPTPLPPNVRPC